MFNNTTQFLFTVQISPTSVTAGNIYSIRLFMNFCQHQTIQMYQNKHSFYIESIASFSSTQFVFMSCAKNSFWSDLNHSFIPNSPTWQLKCI